MIIPINGLHNTSQDPPNGLSDADIDAPEAWDYETGDPDVKIAVFDTGIPMSGSSLSHPDLNDPSRFIIGVDFTTEQNTVRDLNGHGTHITGIIGAETNNNEGIAGVAHGCKIIAFQTIKENGMGYEDDFKDAVYAAVDSGVKVINFSGGWITYIETIRQAVEYADNAGIVQVYAAGNEGSAGLRYPARFAYGPTSPIDTVEGSLHLLQDWDAYHSVISVASTNSFDGRSYFSSYDPDSNYISVAAPGGEGSGWPIVTYDASDIFSTTPNYPFKIQQSHPEVNQEYGYLAGTSMAAPHVSGVAALILSRFPDYILRLKFEIY
jgi:thermitase